MIGEFGTEGDVKRRLKIWRPHVRYWLISAGQAEGVYRGPEVDEATRYPRASLGQRFCVRVMQCVVVAHKSEVDARSHEAGATWQP